MLGFDPATGGGACVLDDGVELSVLPGALDGSGLRHLRPGQRVTVTTVTGEHGRCVDTVRIVGISA
jgi:cold shock CspA family protein